MRRALCCSKPSLSSRNVVEEVNAALEIPFSSPESEAPTSTVAGVAAAGPKTQSVHQE